jgi:hypothetical protein
VYNRVLQSPVQSIRGKSLDFSRSTIPTVNRSEKCGVFPRIDCTGDCSIKRKGFCKNRPFWSNFGPGKEMRREVVGTKELEKLPFPPLQYWNWYIEKRTFLSETKGANSSLGFPLRYQFPCWMSTKKVKELPFPPASPECLRLVNNVYRVSYYLIPYTALPFATNE